MFIDNDHLKSKQSPSIQLECRIYFTGKYQLIPRKKNKNFWFIDDVYGLKDKQFHGQVPQDKDEMEYAVLSSFRNFTERYFARLSL